MPSCVVRNRADVERSFSTSFAGTQNPLDLSRWIHGGLEGRNWQNMRCTPGLCFGAGPSASPPYDDPTAILNGIWGNVQTVEGTIQIGTLPGVNAEVELRARTRILPGIILGYEFLFSITGNSYVEIRRWDGGFSSLADFPLVASGSGPQLATGYRVKGTVSAAGLFKAYVDSGSGYVEICSGTDTTYPTGNPGLGAFQHGGAAGALAWGGFTYFSAQSSEG